MKCISEALFMMDTCTMIEEWMCIRRSFSVSVHLWERVTLHRIATKEMINPVHSAYMSSL